MIRLARSVGVDGVLSISTDRGVVPAAMIAEALGLPGIGVEVAHAMTDKAAMRARLARGGIAQPQHTVVRSPEEIDAALELSGVPAVLKPVDSGGQRGVFLVHDADEARAHLQRRLALSREAAAILESYVDGTELNLLLAMRDGEPTLLIVSDRLRPRGPGFGVGWIHSFPSSLRPEVLERGARRLLRGGRGARPAQRASPSRR